ncbi:transforming acidic coiled-coil-containing protein 3 isoform X2 [Neodiprion pinetum]|uniref:transforming acidic coiled-coil-containing protein 3 isoform X2 n=1 Tax=Neodiprion pinetum TaxID=441929 RepID=UPI001EDDE104|nr:transforming acidic coiled-coil-containing protein 3-like isoform X2 [Neodiprion pinetum]
MSNSGTPNGIGSNCSILGTRDGTRVVLREITATLQNSPPTQPGHRKAASNTQTGKTEHEVKVQFTREFVDAGAPTSRPESLSSECSFQSVTSTPSTKSWNHLRPITPQRAADTSYGNTDIPGLDDLISGWGNIHLNETTDTQETKPLETSLTLDPKLDSSSAEPVEDSEDKQTSYNSIEIHIEDTPDIPQSSANNPALNETRDLSSKSDSENIIIFNKTTELPAAAEECQNNSLQTQDSSLTSNSHNNSRENSHLLNETVELVADCNSTFNKSYSSKSEVLNDTNCISNNQNDAATNCNSPNIAETSENPSNELSATLRIENVSSLNDPLNLPPESTLCTNQNTSSSNEPTLCASNSIVIEPCTVEEPLTKEPDLVIEKPIEPETLEDFKEEEHNPKNPQLNTVTERSVEPETVNSLKEEDHNVKDSQLVPERGTPDSFTDHFAEALSGNTSQFEVESLSIVIPNSYPDISAETFNECIAQEQALQISDNQSLLTPLSIPEENLENTEPAEELPEDQKSVYPETQNSIQSEVESEQSKQVVLENSVEQLSQSLQQAEDLETVSQVTENKVPCVQQNTSTNLEDLKESKSEELPQVDVNVTPFPESNLDTQPISSLSAESYQDAGNSVEEDLNQTSTLREESFHSISSEITSDPYEAFKPVQQSTSLQIIIPEYNFEKLELAAQAIAEEIRNKSSELTEDTDHFFNAQSELFFDPASFDFLLARNNSKNTVRDLRAESLYVKFDPLVGNNTMLPQGPLQVVDGEENAKNNISQPTLGTPKRNPALAAIDRLLLYSPAPGTPKKIEEPPKIEEIVEEVKPVVTPIVDETMTKELELVRSTVLQLDSQLEKERKEREKERQEHELELEKQRSKYENLEKEMVHEMQKKKEMTMVMDEYEKSLSRQMADRERERAIFAQEKAKLQDDLQAANHHLGNTEAAFNDVHLKYERLKSVTSAYKSNEDVLKESIQENVKTIKTLEDRYDQLKNHAMSQLEKANLELEAIRKQHETETVRLQAMIRKAELKSNSLAEMVEQKSKENKELSSILDEFIARVGQNPE